MRPPICTLFMALLMMSQGCSNPKSMTITEKNKDTILNDIKDARGLTVEEAQLLSAYMVRYELAEGFKGLNNGKNNLPLVGKSIGEIIALQKQWIEEQKKSEENAKAIAAEAKAKEDAIAAELRKAITLAVYDKGFVDSNYQAGRYEDYLTYRMVYQNTSSKDIRAFQGHVVFQDLFGDKIMGLGLKISDPIKAGAKAEWSGTSKYNQFDDEDKKMRNTDLKDMKIVWVPEKIIFSDGTTLPKDTIQAD
ncbi:MAG: hypothetical protein JXA73_22960 [Acidobacteria bacterium]|nr:hypothetical protein [Acidobacteriota bacterium]